jgi:hypothetical protein
MNDLEEHVKIVDETTRTAFSDTPYPGDDRLVVDRSGRDPECAEIARTLRGKRWHHVSADMVRRHADALPLLTPEAFRHYLPAFMLAVAHGYYDVDVARDAVLFTLTPPSRREGRRWDDFRARTEQFTDRERRAIEMFLELFDEYYRADWEGAGAEPPSDRVAPALRFWSTPPGAATP